MGRRPGDRRQVFNGIWWRARTGSPWRDVPERYGPWATLYSVFRRWQIDGTWTRTLKELQVRADSEGILEWEISVDSTVCRPHQHAAGAGKRGHAIQTRRLRTAWQPNRTTTRSAAHAAA
jgi:transposase